MGIPSPSRSPSASQQSLSPGFGPAGGSILGSKVGSSKYPTGDPRTSSSQSLYSTVSDTETRRTLLIVYIHGFYGNNQSFQSFPFHVHSFLRSILTDSHIIHSKIYPRYKTYRAIEVARDNFSEWLRPHESPTTDVILVGHSMGGLLAADVVLMPNRSPYSQHPFKHRILGTISMDSPFLGLHPGIVVAGISSLFQPSQSPEEAAAAEAKAKANASSSQQTPESSGSVSRPVSDAMASLSSPPRQPTDPTFNPPFWNDVQFKEQPFVKRIVHFVNKHKAEGIMNATAKHVLSHLEYGSCLLDYHGMSTRYNNVRALEDVDEFQALSEGRPVGSRVRFANYYTLSSGRKKPSKDSKDETRSTPSLSPATTRSLYDGSFLSRETTTETATTGLTRETTVDTATTSATTIPESKVSISVEDYSDVGDPRPQSASSGSGSSSPLHKKPADEGPLVEPSLASLSDLSLRDIDPTPIQDDADFQEAYTRGGLDLIPLPELPPKPVPVDLDQFTDKETRKQAEKESKRLQKAYEQAIKDRARAVRERDKMIVKQRKKMRKDSEKEDNAKIVDEPRSPGTDSEVGLDTVIASTEQQVIEDAQPQGAQKPKKRKKFCTLPRGVSNGSDNTWVDVFMDDMDEVGAHCGLFFPGPHYDKLVGDMGSRILGWVQDDMTKRAVMDMEAQEAALRQQEQPPSYY